MKKTLILVADDDPKIRKLLTVNLEKRNYVVQEASDGDQAIASITQGLPDLAILDLVMPGVSGNDVCVWIREHGLMMPILVLSAHDEEDLKVKALEAGADDYITNPFKTEEFLARMRAVLRRASTSESSPAEAKVKIEGLSIDVNGRRAFVDEVDMHLTRTEFALLAALVKKRDAIITHDELLAKVWGDEYRGSSHYLHVYLGRIRKKMGDKYGALLETIAGQGWQAWVVIGGIAGWLASVAIRSRQGWPTNIVIGAVGAVIGGLLFNLLGNSGLTGFNIWSLPMAAIGALALLGTARLSGPLNRS